MLKLLSLLLAIYVSILSTRVVILERGLPGPIVKEDACMLSCSEDDMNCSEANPEGPQKTCCRLMDEGCRPCTSSCTCVVYCFCGIVHTSFTSFPLISDSAALTFGDEPVLISNYHSDCFRPPEIV